MRRGALAAGAAATILSLATASAGHAAVDRRTPASGASPFPAICNDAAPERRALRRLGGRAVDRCRPDQRGRRRRPGPDRRLPAGSIRDRRRARARGVSVSTNGGESYTPLTAAQLPKFSQCARQPARTSARSDPWVSFAPDRRPRTRSRSSFNDTAQPGQRDPGQPVHEGAAAARRGAPRSRCKRDTEPGGVQRQGVDHRGPERDAEHYVYAIWDRLVFPASARRGAVVPAPAAAFRGPTWFARTTNGGVTLGAGAPDLRPGPERPDDRQPDRRPRQRRPGQRDDGVQATTTAAGNRGGRVAVLRSTEPRRRPGAARSTSTGSAPSG